MPWKNGLGTTREIAVSTEEPYAWRLTSAEVDAGETPFSVFEGYDRNLLLLEGTSLELNWDSKQRILNPNEVFSFPGEARLIARTNTPCRDLNLFNLRTRCTASLHCAAYQPNEEIQFPLQGVEHFVHVLAGNIEFLESNTGAKGVLHPGETLWVSRVPPVNLLNLRTCSGSKAACCAWGIVTPIPTQCA